MSRHLVFCYLTCLLLFVNCTGDGDNSDDRHSTFGKYVYAIDTLKLCDHLSQLLKEDSSWSALTTFWLCDAAVADYYSGASTFHGVWHTRAGFSADADSLLTFLRKTLPAHGLDTTAFLVPQIAADLGVVHRLATDSAETDINLLLPRLDYHLSKAYLRYTVAQRFGCLRPEKLFNHLDYREEKKCYATLFDYQLAQTDLTESLHILTSAPAGPQDGVSEISDRLKFLESSAPTSRLYQTLQRLLVNASPADRRRLSVNMERCRWRTGLDMESEDRQIVVNLPAQRLWAVSEDTVLTMLICCGAVTNKTPLLHSTFTYMQVNPQWIVPQNIVESDFLRHVGDSAFFARNQYFITVRGESDTIPVSSVTEEDLKSDHLRITQERGPGNSLGRLVFRFPNSFAVYLHDTNNRNAFRRERRTLSHGCIRVEKPFELARFLLPDADDWTLDKIRLSIDMAPETEQGKKYAEKHAEDPRPWNLLSYYKMTTKTPLHIVYYTVFPNPSTGAVETWPDLYDYDSAMARALSNIIDSH